MQHFRAMVKIAWMGNGLLALDHIFLTLFLHKMLEENITLRNEWALAFILLALDPRLQYILRKAFFNDRELAFDAYKKHLNG